MEQRDGYVDAVIGEQRGDEGKGRFVDMLAENYDIVARFNGGPNAGHTVILPDNTELKLHGVPSGISHPNVANIIGNGSLVNAGTLPTEMDKVRSKGIEITTDNLFISSGAHLILPHHISEDEVNEAGSRAQGTTKSGIGPAAAAKARREGIRAEIINNDPDKLYETVFRGLMEQRHVRVEEWFPNIDEEAIAHRYVQAALKLGSFVTDTQVYAYTRLSEGARLLAEGAQGGLLDIEGGMYPDVTSTDPTIGGVISGLGIHAGWIRNVYGIAKALPSHVGDGEFITEIDDPKLLARLHGDMNAKDAEIGTTSGRIRRLGYFDIPVLRRSDMRNNITERGITKLDWVERYGNQLKVCTDYKRKGKTLSIACDAAYKLKEAEPDYEKLPNWTENIQDVRKFEKLPHNAQNFIYFIVDKTGKPITRIGVGPRRDQVIECEITP